MRGGEGKREEKRKGREREVGRCYSADFEDGKEATSQEMCVTSRSWKGQGNRWSSSGSSRRNAALLTPLF